MKDNSAVGIKKSKKHSIIIRFDLSKQQDQEGLRHFLGKPQQFTIIQIKEFPEYNIAYLEFINTAEYRKIYLGEKTPDLDLGGKFI